MHQEKKEYFSVIKKLKGFILQGVLLMSVEAVRINFLSTLKKRGRRRGKKRWKAVFKEERLS